MLWNLILTAAETPTEAGAHEITVEEHIKTKKHKKHKRHHAHKMHGCAAVITKESDDITRALNAGALPLMHHKK